MNKIEQSNESTSFYLSQSSASTSYLEETTTNTLFYYQISILKWLVWSVLILIILSTIFGNTLVIIAVYKIRKLQSQTNLFLVSLAAADCMVALFVMPTSLLVNILDYKFPFHSSIWCTLWIAFDVFLCTSSINHMSTMSVVRYMKIKFPLKYGLNKTKRHAFMQIVFVWFISFGICSPLLVMGIHDAKNVYEASTSTCSLFNKNFRLYGSIFAFYIPFLVMLVAYVATIRALKQVLDKKKVNQIISFKKRPYASSMDEIYKIVPQYDGKREEQCNKKVNSEQDEVVDVGGANRPQTTANLMTRKVFLLKKSNTFGESIADIPATVTIGLDGKSISNYNVHSSLSDFKSISSNKITTTKTNKTFRKYDRLKQRRKAIRNQINQLNTQPQKSHKISSNYNANHSNNNNNHYQQAAYNERKSLKVLIIMFIIFITLWCPFFVLNTFSALCEDFVKLLLSEHESLVYFVLTWLGYFSSMLNPIVYTMFNKNFRIAFIKILKCSL